MGNRLIILFLFFSALAYSQSQYGGDYFVAPVTSGGSWTGDGSWGDPFIHPQQAVDVAEAGDTIYFRGGVISVDSSFYEQGLIRISPGEGYGESGTYGNPICYFNYPGETPIIDCSNAIPYGGSYNYLRVFNITAARYLNFRGFTVRNVFQSDGDDHVGAFNCINVTHLNFNQVVCHDIGGRAYYYESGAWDEELEGLPPPFIGDTSTWLNCDVYNCVDSLGADPGNSADGWKVIGYKGNKMTWTGCRSWQCADDGYDNTREATMIWDNCWAWDIGLVGTTQGNGNGIKTGGSRDTIPYVHKIIKNCVIAWCNNPSSAAGGLEWIEYQNDPGGEVDPPEIYYRSNGRVYNNMIYNCQFGVLGTSNPAHPFLNNVYRNNIVMGSKINPCGDESNIILTKYKYPESNNSWDWYDPSPGSCPAWFVETDSVTITADDFKYGLDSATIYSMLSAPRKVNGSLPTNPFMLAEGSDLIDAGTQIWASDSVDFQLSYYGSAPDIGAFESNYGARTRKPMTGGNKPLIYNGKILGNDE